MPTFFFFVDDAKLGSFSVKYYQICFVIYKFCKLTVSTFLDFVNMPMNSRFFIAEKFG